MFILHKIDASHEVMTICLECLSCARVSGQPARLPCLNVYFARVFLASLGAAASVLSNRLTCSRLPARRSRRALHLAVLARLSASCRHGRILGVSLVYPVNASVYLMKQRS